MLTLFKSSLALTILGFLIFYFLDIVLLFGIFFGIISLFIDLFVCLGAERSSANLVSFALFSEILFFSILFLYRKFFA